jgi:hypothetical protein
MAYAAAGIKQPGEDDVGSLSLCEALKRDVLAPSTARAALHQASVRSGSRCFGMPGLTDAFMVETASNPGANRRATPIAHWMFRGYKRSDPHRWSSVRCAAKSTMLLQPSRTLGKSCCSARLALVGAFAADARSIAPGQRHTCASGIATCGTRKFDDEDGVEADSRSPPARLTRDVARACADPSSMFREIADGRGPYPCACGAQP